MYVRVSAGVRNSHYMDYFTGANAVSTVFPINKYCRISNSDSVGWILFVLVGLVLLVLVGWVLLVLVGWVLLVLCLKPTNQPIENPTTKANQQAKPTNQPRAIYSNVSQRAFKEPKSINYNSRVPPVHSTKCAFDCPLFHSLALHRFTHAH